MTVYRDLSPSPERTGRACAWIEQDGRVLMAARDAFGWTLPGGGIHPGETPQQAAVREAWEECGAHAEVIGEGLVIQGRSGVDAVCYPMRLRGLEPSPEGRPVAWADLRSAFWRADPQLLQVLSARGEGVPPESMIPVLQRLHRLKWRLAAGKIL